MSHPVNTSILEEAGAQYEMCKYAGDYLSCVGIIERLRSQGFSSEADNLQNDLNNTPVNKFAPKASFSKTSMKTITITVAVDGNSVSREYLWSENMEEQDWGTRVQDMLDTIEKSEEIKF